MKLLLTSGLLALGLISSADAVTLTPGSGWQPFTFEGEDSQWSETFEFVLDGKYRLKVTDRSYNTGSSFEVQQLVGGSYVPIFTTPVVAGAISANVGFDEAYDDGSWSSAAYTFNAGSYQIRGLVVTPNINDAGIGGVRLDVVPLPPAFLAFASALGALGFVKRRCSKAAA